MSSLNSLQKKLQDPVMMEEKGQETPTRTNRNKKQIILTTSALLLLVVAVGWSCSTDIPLDASSRSLRTARSLLQVPILVKTKVPKVPPSEKLVEENGQNRPSERLGKKKDGFVHMAEQTAKQRRWNMKALQQVRTGDGACGDWDQWELQGQQRFEYYHANNPREMNRDNYEFSNVGRYTCDAPHPQFQKDDIQIHFERFGPFTSTGNSDWSRFMNYESFGDLDYRDYHSDNLLMRKQLAGKDIYVRGSFAAIVKKDGSFHSYPPLHMHHLHLHPYSNGYETMDKILPKYKGKDATIEVPDEFMGIVGGGSAYYDHHIIAQQHGDSVCHDPETGKDDFSCLLHILPDGHGMRVRNSHGFRLDFDVNDVRTSNTKSDHMEPLEPLEWYVEVAILWTEKPQIPATYLQIAAPESGTGPSTYAIPLDDSSSMIYYNYTHDWRDDDDLQTHPMDPRLAAGVKGMQGLGAGTVTNIVGHVHHTMFDSLFIFQESKKKHKVFKAIDSIRPKGHPLPYIPECHDDTLEDVKDRVTKRAIKAGGKLVCEVTKPSLVWMKSPTGHIPHSAGSEPKPPSYAYRDRLMDLHCLENIRLEPGDTLTFVSFTKSRTTSTLGPIERKSFRHEVAGIYEGGAFAQSEHTILRLDFVSDKAVEQEDTEDLYAPPSLYLTQRWVTGVPDEACINYMKGLEWFSFVNKGFLGWDDFEDPDVDYCEESHDRMVAMMDQCPASIDLDGKKKKNKGGNGGRPDETKAEEMQEEFREEEGVTQYHDIDMSNSESFDEDEGFS